MENFPEIPLAPFRDRALSGIGVFGGRMVGWVLVEILARGYLDSGRSSC